MSDANARCGHGLRYERRGMHFHYTGDAWAFCNLPAAE